MADVSSEKSLDDFFAKRDKKKKKDKGKAKESAASSSMGLKRSKKENEKSFKGDGQDGNMDKEDEDWKEQKEVDYSGLRLQAMQISDDKEEDDYEDGDREHDEDGDVLLTAGGEKMSGPWNKSTNAPAQTPPVEDVETPEKPAGVYRPPGARYSSSKRGQTQGPPEIFSDTQFPSLMATGKHVETRKDREIDKTFEVVKHKGRGRDDGNATAAMQHLQLDNQYAVLGDK